MDDVQLAKSDGPRFDQAKFTGAAKHIHERQEFTPQMMQDEPVKALTRETYTALSAAINIGREVPPELRVALEENTFIFSGFKTYQQLREVSGLLKDEDGGFKSFEAFSRDIQQLNDRYNKNYLRAEYNYATQSTQMAVKWHDFVADGDDYLLQYRTSGDDRVRAEHAALHGVTLPIGDAFWDEYLPPLDWGCRCTVVQVPREKYQQSDPDEAKALGEAATAGPKKKIFRFNPGKTLKLFPPKHPYLPKGCGNCARKNSLQLYTPVDRGLPQCQACGVLSRQCLENNKIAVNAWRDQDLPQPSSKLSIESSNLCSGSILISRGSVRNTLGHTDNLAVRRIFLNLEASISQWQYIGWKPCVIDPRTGIRKHPEADYFIYYQVTISGRTYYANVKAQGNYKREELYCVRDSLNSQIALNPGPPPNIEDYRL